MAKCSSFPYYILIRTQHSGQPCHTADPSGLQPRGRGMQAEVCAQVCWSLWALAQVTYSPQILMLESLIRKLARVLEEIQHSLFKSAWWFQLCFACIQCVSRIPNFRERMFKIRSMPKPWLEMLKGWTEHRLNLIFSIWAVFIRQNSKPEQLSDRFSSIPNSPLYQDDILSRFNTSPNQIHVIAIHLSESNYFQAVVRSCFQEKAIERPRPSSEQICLLQPLQYCVAFYRMWIKCALLQWKYKAVQNS